MTDQVHYLTKQGLEELETRLAYLRNVRRAEVAERLHLAMAEGGEMSENAEYDDAKNEQSFLEGEIARLEIILSNVRLIEGTEGKKKVVALGDKVTVLEKGKKQTELFHIVGAAEADPRKGRISNESPLGRALLGRKNNEKVTIKAPDGEIVFTVKQIE
jgi:transcription elongation factor GreA